MTYNMSERSLSFQWALFLSLLWSHGECLSFRCNRWTSLYGGTRSSARAFTWERCTTLCDGNFDPSLLAPACHVVWWRLHASGLAIQCQISVVSGNRIRQPIHLVHLPVATTVWGQVALVTTKRDSLRPRQSPCPDPRLSHVTGIVSTMESDDVISNKLLTWLLRTQNTTKGRLNGRQTKSNEPNPHKKIAHHNHTLLQSSVQLESKIYVPTPPMIKTKINGASKQIHRVRNVLQCAFCKHLDPTKMLWWICDKCWNKIWLKTDKIRHYAWSGRALKNGWVVCHVLTLSLDPDVPLESRVAFLCSLCCRPFFPKLPHLRKFVISFVWGVCIEVRIRWRSSARTLGVLRTECHTHISHLIPVLASRVSQLTSSIMSSATRSHFHSVCTCVFRWAVSM